MLQLVKSERQNRIPIKQDRPNYVLGEFYDASLSPVAEAGDLALIAQYAPPQNNDLVAYEYDGERYVRWWHQVGSTVRLTDAQGNEEFIHLSNILVLGVVREIRRPIFNGAPYKRLLSEILRITTQLLWPLIGAAILIDQFIDLIDDVEVIM